MIIHAIFSDPSSVFGMDFLVQAAGTKAPGHFTAMKAAHAARKVQSCLENLEQRKLDQAGHLRLTSDLGVMCIMCSYECSYECCWMRMDANGISSSFERIYIGIFFLNRINVPNVLLDSKGCEGCGIWMDLVGEGHHPKNTLW